MATLDRWKHLLHPPRALSFPKLELLGRDFEPALLEGSGELRLTSPSSFEFTLRAKPADPSYATRQLLLQALNPYDALARFRLCGTDQEGVEWTLGWTVPQVDPSGDEWVVIGRTNGIGTTDESPTAADTPSTELLFVVPPEHPLISLMGGAAPLSSAHRYFTEVLGSKISVAYDTASQVLSIIATHSDELPPTYTENWLGEPLRILFGQLIFPRLVARNLEGRRSHIFVRPIHSLKATTTWAAFLRNENALDVRRNFWPRYEELLTLIARARDKKGFPNFEAHKITRLYEEIIQATIGTRWVWALTLASSIEALANMLDRTGGPRKDVSTETVDALIKHITQFALEEEREKQEQGEEREREQRTIGRLKMSAINAVKRASNVSLPDTLRDLVSGGVLTQWQYDAWDKLRNSVMHGSLVSPYSSEEEDGKLLALLEIMHALTLEVLKVSAAAH